MDRKELEPLIAKVAEMRRKLREADEAARTAAGVRDTAADNLHIAQRDLDRAVTARVDELDPKPEIFVKP